MAKSGQRKCLCCQLFFEVDPRIGQRQRYCSEPDCQRASKTASQAAWLSKPHNQDYFRDPVHVARVQAWRTQHPGYSRAKRRTPPALEDSLITQVHDCIEESSNRGDAAETRQTPALQDLITAPLPVLAGLIAHLFQVSSKTTCTESVHARNRRFSSSISPRVRLPRSTGASTPPSPWAPRAGA